MMSESKKIFTMKKIGRTHELWVRPNLRLCHNWNFFSNSYSCNFKDFIKPKKSLKVPFKKGRGLTNWMSIVRKGQNISGIEPRRPVTETELREHNTRFSKHLKYFARLILTSWPQVAFIWMQLDSKIRF